MHLTLLSSCYTYICNYYFTLTSCGITKRTNIFTVYVIFPKLSPTWFTSSWSWHFRKLYRQRTYLHLHTYIWQPYNISLLFERETSSFFSPISSSFLARSRTRPEIWDLNLSARPKTATLSLSTFSSQLVFFSPHSPYLARINREEVLNLMYAPTN